MGYMSAKEIRDRIAFLIRDSAAYYNHRSSNNIAITKLESELCALAPYPFCRTPKECVGKGYCTKDPACNE